MYAISSPKPGWQQQLAQAFTQAADLLDFLQLDIRDFPACQQAGEDFKLKVPLAYARKMQQGDPRDPLFLQVMSQQQELTAVKGFSHDPVGDLEAAASPGLLHKYQGRVLLITTGACAVHCRYCFRRHFPYGDHATLPQATMDYIRQQDDIHEVILSGGDPLLLSDEKLDRLLREIGDIPHIKRLRIHTRLPVVLPYRITDNLLNILTASPLNTCMVIHANHGNEIGPEEHRVLKRLSHGGISLLNQSVLLAGINDTADRLIQLSERLFEAGVLPYYLHLLDPVAGAAHFMVDEQRARTIMSQMRQQLSGYLLPRLVREIPGEASKMPVFGL